MTFGGLIESLGEKLGVEIEDAGGAFALEANYLYSGTGGATLAVNPADGHLHLQKYNCLGRLDCDKALDMLTRFVETAALWRRLRGEAPGEGDQPGVRAAVCGTSRLHAGVTSVTI